MLNFKSELERIIVDNFIKYNVNPFPLNDGKIIAFDPENQIHYINSVISSSNLNIAVSKNLKTSKQRRKALEIIKVFQSNQIPFTWCVVSNSKILKEKEFFLANNFICSEIIKAMTIDLKNYDQKEQLNENETIKFVETLDDVEKFRSIIKSSFSLSLIDLQKYYGIYELRKMQDFDYQVYLTVDGIPVSTGHFYYQEDLVIIDDIATNPDFQRRGYAKRMLFHLLNKAKAMGFNKAVLLASEQGFMLYKTIGFEEINLYFTVYELNY